MTGGGGFALSTLQTKQTTKDNAPGLQHDPDEWKTGEEPMTNAQRSYLETLCRETGEEFDDRLSKAEASKRTRQKGSPTRSICVQFPP
jgi:hypothetical protein